MATECIDTFEMGGRQFTVLLKPSATYLRADGHLWGGSLGEDLQPQEAIEQAKLRAAMMLINEREQEEGFVHRLFKSPLSEDEVAMAQDYVLFTATLPMTTGSIVPVQADVVYAPFNQNTYLCTMQGWRYVGSYPNQDEAVAALAPWCLAEKAHPCREGHRKLLADASRPGAGHGERAPRSRSQRFWASARIEFYVLVFLLSVSGLLWLWYQAVETWPWALPGACALMFLGGCVALWKQRREKKQAKRADD